jgi:putative thioredoxin
MPVDVNEANFRTEVMEASKTTPVLIDFWAEWCAPCRMLGPVLDKLETAYKGRFKLVKVNTDENPNLAVAFQISGIPAVKLVMDGRLKSEFTGALPEPQVRKFLDQHLPAPGLEAEEELAEQNPLEAAERALQNKTEGPEASAILWQAAVQLFAAGDDPQSIQRYLDAIPEVGAAQSEARNSLLAYLGRTPDAQERALLQKLLAGDERPALEFFLARVEAAPFAERGAEKAGLVLCFHFLGSASDLANEYRRKLAAILF